MARIRRVRDGGELGMVIVESAAVLGVAMAACATRRTQIFHALGGPIAHRQLVTFSPDEARWNAVRVVVLSAILLSLPIVAYKLSAYALPTTGGIDPALLAVPVLCLAGIVVGWLAVLPVGVHDLTHYGHPTHEYLPRASDYIDFSLGTLIASGAGGAALGVCALRRAG
ncbi:MAG TPA: twin-arginine translocase subunit TatC [Gaiellales bacterium]|jgi:Sec-independent protein secretion pathway component TatC|nr:twin-arginine translocase subunit TatC [Gaiellales bacterium]